MAGHGKDTQAEHGERVAFVYKLIINNVRSNQDIFGYISELRKKPLKARLAAGWPKEKEPKGERQIENYILDARRQLVANSIKDTTEMTEELISQHYELAKKAIKARKYGVARGCLKEIAYLKGLGKININGKFKHDITMDDLLKTVKDDIGT